jgi:hypothetical protein
MRTLGCALMLAAIVGWTSARSQERSLWTASDTATMAFTGEIYSLTDHGMDFQFGSVSFEPVAGHDGVYRITSPFAKIGPGGQNWVCPPSGAQPTYLARIEYEPAEEWDRGPALALLAFVGSAVPPPAVLRYPDVPLQDVPGFCAGFSYRAPQP